jgi:hypothetical protein
MMEFCLKKIVNCKFFDMTKTIPIIVKCTLMQTNVINLKIKIEILCLYFNFETEEEAAQPE